MTGFGVGRARVEGEEISVELRSVNHKFLEVKARLPRELSALEPVVLKAVKDRLSRGAVDVAIRRASAAETERTPVVDVALAKEYARAFAELSSAVGLGDTVVRLQDLVSQPGVLRLEERTANVEHAAAALDAALVEAIGALRSMRATEGKALTTDLTSRLASIEAWTAEIAELSPKTVDDYKRRLEERIAELSSGHSLDPQRLAQEVALFADRTDVAEEMTRLASHLSQFRQLIASGEPVGRKMDFLVQEMHREVNTTGSKSQHPEISNRIVSMKAELERIREQVANVE